MPPPSTPPPQTTEIFIDGSSLGNPGPAGVGVVMYGPDGRPSATLSKYIGETTNNVAEYLALLYALQEAQRCGLRRAAIKTDSELLAKQCSGEYKVRDGTLRLLHDLAQHGVKNFERVTIEHVSRTKNREADRLAKAASASRRDQSTPGAVPPPCSC